jgi:PAS domain-containing protein
MEAAAAAIEPSIVLEELPVGIVKLDADRNVVFANRAAKRLVNWSTFGSDLASVPEHLLNAEFQQGERWLRTVSSPSADGGYTVFVEDITEARRRAAEDRVFMQAVLDALDIGIAAYDASGCLRLLNRCAQESYPEPYQALASEPLPLRQIRTTVTGDGKTLAVCRRELKDSAGTRLGALVAGHDVTHRMRSAARLRHGVREFRALFNQAPVAYHEIDRDGIIRRVNRAELRLLERTREQMLGHAVWEFV